MASKDWYEQGWEQLGAWWANLDSRRTEFEAKYPILATEKTKLAAIAAWFAYWVPARHAFDEAGKQCTKFMNDIAGNDPNVDPPTTFAYSAGSGAPPDPEPGVEKFIRDVRRETVNYGNYSKADGEALGFEATIPQPISPENVKPSIQLFAAAHDYEITIVVTGRNGVSSWDIYMTRKGGNRTKVDTRDGKSGNIFIIPTTPGDPERVQIDVQLRKNNQNYGQPSDPAFVTANP